MSFLRKNNNLENDMAALETRISALENEILPLLKKIDKRLAVLENHMSHIVAEAFGKEKRKD